MGQAASLFGKPLDKVEFADVQAFCSQQVKEGFNLDYKQDLSTKTLLKTIASFANTRGGVVIVGVRDHDDKPVLPAEGIDWYESMALTVTSSIVDNMNPYLSVQVHVCDPEAGKTFLIIDVPESHEAPHWLFNKSELYVRRDDRSSHTDWFRLAAENEWEFLRNKREKSVSLRKFALGDVQTIYAHERLIHLNQGNNPSYRFSLKNFLVTTVVPMFPMTTMGDTVDLMNYTNSSTIDTILRGYTYPQVNSATKIFQEGAYRYQPGGDGLEEAFNALTRFGVVANYEAIVNENINSVGEYVWFSHILESIEKVVRYSSNFYEHIGYSGSLSLDVKFKGSPNIAMISENQFDARRLPRNVTGEFESNFETSTFEIKELKNLVDLLREVMTEFSRAFGFTGDVQSKVNQYLHDSAVYQAIV